MQGLLLLSGGLMLWQKILTLAKNHLAPMVFYSFVFPFLNGLQAAVANPRKVSLSHTAAVSLDPANT